jgi:N-acetylglucosamine kinase
MRLAIDIGATKTEFGCFDDDQTQKSSLVAPTPNTTWEDFSEFLLKATASAESEAGSIDDIGVSIAGMIRPDSGNVYCANLEFLSGRKLQPGLSALLGKPVLIANDAACFTLAETRAGIATGYQNVFGLILGSGIGGAAIVNGQTVQGGSGFSGEWGHGNRLDHAVESLQLSKRQCGCGASNCLDLFGAGIGMANIFFDYSGRKSDARSILSQWHLEDATATRTVDAFVHLVSNALALVVNIVDPQIMPVGGGLSNDAKLIAYLDTETRRKSLGNLNNELVVPGQFNTNGCLRGASFL